MKTYSAKPADITRKWYLIDASEQPLGRIASAVAILLLGKDKPMFTKHIDVGDYVVIVNAEKIQVTGQKLDTKMYYRHSGYMSGLTETTLRESQAKDPTRALFLAIRGMIPVNRLRTARLERLKIFGGTEHAHTAQQPKLISVNDVKGSK